MIIIGLVHEAKQVFEINIKSSKGQFNPKINIHIFAISCS